MDTQRLNLDPSETWDTRLRDAQRRNDRPAQLALLRERYSGAVVGGDPWWELLVSRKRPTLLVDGVDIEPGHVMRMRRCATEIVEAAREAVGLVLRPEWERACVAGLKFGERPPLWVEEAVSASARACDGMGPSTSTEFDLLANAYKWLAWPEAVDSARRAIHCAAHTLWSVSPGRPLGPDRLADLTRWELEYARILRDRMLSE